MVKDAPPDSSPVAETETSPKKRSESIADASESAPRAKRGKYTLLACNECKRRKLKCVPSSDGTTCERCTTRKLLCVFAVNSPKPEKKRDDSGQIQVLSEELAQVRHELANLANAVYELKQHRSPYAVGITPGTTDHVSSIHSPSIVSKESVPKHPQFVGPTRPAYGLMIAERSLTRMGIPDSPSSQSGSRAASPDPQPASGPMGMATDTEFWAQCSAAEAARLMAVFEEEVESVYPYTDIAELAAKSGDILRVIRQPELLEDESNELSKTLSYADIDLAKLAVAVGIAIEGHGKNDLCAAIAASVANHTARISQTEVSLKGIQCLMTLSIYYFHSDDELLAWRAIGVAAREALEMGLHRKRSLYDNFTDTSARQTALRVFCCCYILDRRWSFGTSLSFALVDGDIDPSLLEIELDSPYLKCMVGYARLCSKLWEAIPPFGSPNNCIPPQLAHVLDSSAQEWIDSIPPHLQMRRPGIALHSTRSQPRVLHRLRALLYLRGNVARLSIYKYHLLSPAAAAADPRRARIAVELAQDTVAVLVHLHASSDIYTRQQNVFNYFLASAFAVIALAVCHAPKAFGPGCAQSFVDAAGLVKGFSRHSMASKRLWKSIRGLWPRLQSLGAGIAREPDGTNREAGRWQNAQVNASDVFDGDAAGQRAAGSTGNGLWNYNTRRPGAGIGTDGAGKELFPGMNPDILNLFDSLGDDSTFSGSNFEPGAYDGMEADTEGGEFSRLFLQGLM